MNGISFSQGKIWKENRKFFIVTLTNMGMGNKFKMDGIIQEECADFCSALREKIRTSQSREIVVRPKILKLDLDRLGFFFEN